MSFWMENVLIPPTHILLMTYIKRLIILARTIKDPLSISANSDFIKKSRIFQVFTELQKFRIYTDSKEDYKIPINGIMKQKTKRKMKNEKLLPFQK